MTEAAATLAPLRRPVPGWLPWLTWALGALLFCYGFFQRVASSVMIDHLMRDLAAGLLAGLALRKRGGSQP